ncbi:MAG: hypothetical protein J5967_03020, partial [Oscillospiraceae bacterium]|nr:hypothetical protein [Oscillospiraceae bacterium]
PAGAAGQPGPAGKAPYEAAAEAGYTGTEATFYAALAAIPYHNARHLPEGADPILVQTDNLTNGAVTAAKVRADSRTQYLELPVPAEWSGTGPYTQTLAVEGLRETDRPKVHFRAPESFGELENQQDAFGQLYDVVTAQGAVTLYAKIRPAAAFAVTLEVTRI